MTILSLACDHDLSHRYAQYLESKRKRYDYSYWGARWELALSRCFSSQYHNECIKHLERSIAGKETTDFEYDFMINGIKVDPKVSMPRRLRSNLILDVGKPQQDVIYVLGEALSLNLDECDMEFEYRGSSFGEKSLFIPTLECWGLCNKLYAPKLEDWVWLTQRLGL